jgi:hypothetical protein
MSPATLDLDAVNRPALPLRVSFLHAPTARGGPGPLADFVRQRRTVALDLLLFAHAISPLTNPDPIVAPASAWAATLDAGDRPGSRAMISRSWTWLERCGLITTSPSGRTRSIKLLRENGSGRPWQHPADGHEPYFHLPHAYWEGGFANDLSLSAKATLLIALSLQARGEQHFELPLERGSAWYGLSARTLRAGLRELQAVGLVRTWVKQRSSERSPVGYTFDRRHSLNPIQSVAWRRLNLTEPS